MSGVARGIGERARCPCGKEKMMTGDEAQESYSVAFRGQASRLPALLEQLRKAELDSL